MLLVSRRAVWCDGVPEKLRRKSKIFFTSHLLRASDTLAHHADAKRADPHSFIEKDVKLIEKSNSYLVPPPFWQEGVGPLPTPSGARGPSGEGPSQFMHTRPRSTVEPIPPVATQSEGSDAGFFGFLFFSGLNKRLRCRARSR